LLFFLLDFLIDFFTKFIIFVDMFFVQNLFKTYSQPNISLVHFSCYCYCQYTHTHTHTHIHERVTLNVNNLSIFIFMLIGSIRFNPFDLWPKPYSGLTLKLGFKIMIINTFYFYADLVQPDPWSRPRLVTRALSRIDSRVEF
jgi:hypothetical protein